MRPAIILISQVEEIQNALVIYKAALLYIFFNSLNRWNSGTSLKYHNWNPYKTMGRTHVL